MTLGLPTLKSYDNGDRMIRLNATYLLAQVYEVSVDALIEQKKRFATMRLKYITMRVIILDFG